MIKTKGCSLWFLFVNREPEKFKESSFVIIFIERTFLVGSFRKLCGCLILIAKDSAIINPENPVKQERKELLSSSRAKKPSIQGENPALGIFPKATMYAKIAFWF
ncbi:hypothetical protein [Bacillus sp. P14.5]|uniref:hypothetical protein n=1 Tax=Bacillus sp. P14.5 TaxID=1983400 RepID=UPI000DEB5FE8|nr:hypothetical protein [Bacillus sp. P14.5]